jgi:enoyl-CoA hydratase/carnithine racemase
VHVSREASLAWLVFDHPERRNAVSLEMWQAIPDLAATLDADPSVRVIGLRGAGDVAFVSGADISEFASTRTGASAAQVYEDTPRPPRCQREEAGRRGDPRLRVGGGMALALIADPRRRRRRASRFPPPAWSRLPRRGIDALVRLVGPARREVLFHARRFAAGALRARTQNEVVPATSRLQ